MIKSNHSIMDVSAGSFLGEVYRSSMVLVVKVRAFSRPANPPSRPRNDRDKSAKYCFCDALTVTEKAQDVFIFAVSWQTNNVTPGAATIPGLPDYTR